MAAVLFVIYLPKEDGSTSTESADDRSDIFNVNGSSEEEKSDSETSRLSSTTFDSALSTIDETVIDVEHVDIVSDSVANTSVAGADKNTDASDVISSKNKSSIVQESDINTAELSSDNETVTLNNDDASNTSTSHLVEFVPKLTLKEVVAATLSTLDISSGVWSENEEYLQVSFIEGGGSRCEEILNKLANVGIGKIAGSSISILPSNIHVKRDESDEEEEKEKDETLIEETESNFKKSIKSRLVVEQVVESVKSNAEFTFDYVMFVLLASMIAAMGLVENSSVILVASMLISPIMGPILAGTFGAVIQNTALRNLGIKSELKGLGLCILFGFLFGLISGGVGLHGAVWGSTEEWPTNEMKSRGMWRSLWVGLLIALPSGAGVALSVLGGNAGSLVGVAISASLLPPAVNAGMLWAYAFLSSIAPPDVVSHVGSVVTPSINISVNTSIENSTISNGIIYNDTGHHSTECPPFINNKYKTLYSCDMATETAIMGTISLSLTLVNILCIFLVAIVVLKIKEVAPTTAMTSEVEKFWKSDIKVARDSYKTAKGKESANLGKNFLAEWKKLTNPNPKAEEEEFQKEQVRGFMKDAEKSSHILEMMHTKRTRTDFTDDLPLSPGSMQAASKYCTVRRRRKFGCSVYETIHNNSPLTPIIIKAESTAFTWLQKTRLKQAKKKIKEDKFSSNESVKVVHFHRSHPNKKRKKKFTVESVDETGEY